MRLGHGMMEALKEFPVPQDIGGMRSFLGLVEQVSFVFKD